MQGFEGFEFLPTLISIVVVLVVLGATLIALRWASSFRVGGRDRRGHRLVDIVERHPIGRSGSIVVMRYGGSEHVLGVTDSSITHLAESMAGATIDLRDDTVPLPDAQPIPDAGPLTEEDAQETAAGLLDRLRAKTVRH